MVKVKMKTLGRCSDVFIAEFEHILYLNIFYTYL